MIEYRIENNLNADEFKYILERSTLGERRPIHEMDQLTSMLKHGNLIITARDNGKLVGISRSLTDFQFCTYLSDLAVDQNYQRMGIGRELIRRTKLETPNATLILLAAPEAVNYYSKVGMDKFQFCYILRDVDAIN